jgi:uncharacterized protein (TIGR02145 family)
MQIFSFNFMRFKDFYKNISIMKKITFLLIMSVVLFGCKPDAIDKGFTTEEIENIVTKAEEIVESSLSNALQAGELVDPNTIADGVKLLENVVSAEASGNTILMHLTDGSELYYFFVDNTDDRWFTTNETKATKSEPLKSKSQTNTSDIIKPSGSGKALILAPFQFQATRDLETIYNTLQAAGYITESFIDQGADLDKFRGSFMSAYDIVIIYTHGGASSSNGVNITSIMTGEKVSDKQTSQLKQQGKKGWKTSKTSGVEGVFYGITPTWISETTYSPAYFKNTWIFVNGCKTSFWDNTVEGSFSKAFFDLGAEAYCGYKQTMYAPDVTKISTSMVEYFCTGLSFMDASESTRESVIIEKQSLLRDTIITTHSFDALQKNTSVPFYIVPPKGYQLLPSVNLSSINNITISTAECACEVTYEGWRSVTARGVCWSTSQNPTTANSKTTNGTGLGTYTSNITGLSPNTTYYVRAYATNAEGTAYGEQRSFKTNQDTADDTFTDSRDGHVYKTVTIGNQTWMAENLAYLPSVVGPGTGSYSNPYYYVYDYNGTDLSAAKATNNYNTYGVLYNWPAALTACPAGWHLPSDAEWVQLETFLSNNGYRYDGKTGPQSDSETVQDKIAKSLASESGWWSYSGTGTVGSTDYPAYRNKSGFTALPGGSRYDSGAFGELGGFGYWWSSTKGSSSYAWSRYLYYLNSRVDRYHSPKGFGFSVRCVRE